jgi:hypothetical protein
MVRCSENGCLGFMGFIFSVGGWEKRTAGLGCAISFLFNLLSILFFFLCMHGGGMMFMPNLGTSFEAWCFSSIYDTLRQDNIWPNEQIHTNLYQLYISTLPNASYLPFPTHITKACCPSHPLKKLRSTLKPDMSMCTRTHNAFEAPRTASTSQFEDCTCATHDPSSVTDCTLTVPTAIYCNAQDGHHSGRSLLFTLPGPFLKHRQSHRKRLTRRTTRDARAPQAMAQISPSFSEFTWRVENSRPNGG